MDKPEKPFDAVAQDYDATFTRTQTGLLQRRQVWRFLEPYLPPVGSRVLELNAGTGEDALMLAERGFQVCCTDISAGMLARAKEKIVRSGTANLVQFERLDAADMDGFLAKNLPFALVFSNFGGLNCLSPAALLRSRMTTALPPGGRFAAVVMGRFCLWESLYFMAKGRFRNAFRRLRAGPVQAPLGNAASIDIWYYAPRDFAAFFPDCKVLTVKPVGVFLPPSYLDLFFRRKPRLLGLLQWLEARFSPARASAWSDHYLIVLEKS